MSKTVGDLMEDIERIDKMCKAFLDYNLKNITAEELVERIDVSWTRSYLNKYADLLRSTEIKESKRV